MCFFFPFLGYYIPGLHHFAVSRVKILEFFSNYDQMIHFTVNKNVLTCLWTTPQHVWHYKRRRVTVGLPGSPLWLFCSPGLAKVAW